MPLALLLGAYLLGSIPTGVLLARLVGIDPRQAGSGNIGATNVLRTAGRSLGLLTLLGDMLKGALPVAAAMQLSMPHWFAAAAGVAAVGGHVFSCFLRFRGGKGVATSAGAFALLAPIATALAVTAFIVTAWVTRYVSLASLIAATVLTLSSWWTASAPVGLAALLVSLAIVGTHRDNIARLRSGTETRLGSRRPA